MKATRKLVASSVVAVAAATAGVPAAAQAAPSVQEPWARPTVEGQAGGGGFLRIVGGSADDRLVSARAGVARSVELHSMSMEGDVMRMRQVDGIDIPAGKTVTLAPGGLHIMLIGLNKTLKNGNHFPLTLRFEKAGELQVEMQVMPRPPGTAAPAAPVHSSGHPPGPR